MDELVLTERVGAVLLVRINRPGARNAINRAVARALQTAFDEFEADSTLRAGVLTGEGGVFCAGMDLKAFREGDRGNAERGFGGLVGAPLSKPLIAAVEGYAVAGGWEIALACDFVVAADDSKFGLPEVKWGLAPAGGSLLRLPAHCPLGIAKELALTGRMLDARRAYELGLVNHLTGHSGALAKALDVAREIAENAPVAVPAVKKVLDLHEYRQSDATWQAQTKLTDPIFATADAEEGVAAFAEKRKPRWQGR